MEMRNGKRNKKTALAAVLALALTSGTAAAMPTGGHVVAGDVTTKQIVPGVQRQDPLTDFSPDSGTWLHVNADSIINWDSFSIGPGESWLISTGVNDKGGALLNRVIGTLPSRLDGSLYESGTHPMVLVNPNGIVVGSAAKLNCTGLLLSTLDITDNEFLNKFAKGAQASFTTPSDRDIAASVTVRKGASMNAMNYGTTLGIGALGGTVEVADGVTFSVGRVLLGAAESAQMDEAGHFDAVAATDNAVNFSGDFPFIEEQYASGTERATMFGGTVHLSGATATVMNDGGHVGDLMVMAGKKLHGAYKDYSVTAESGNDVTLENVDFHFQKLTTLGNRTVKYGTNNVLDVPAEGLSLQNLVEESSTTPIPDPTPEPVPDPTPDPTPDSTPDPTLDPTPEPGNQEKDYDWDKEIRAFLGSELDSYLQQVREASEQARKSTQALNKTEEENAPSSNTDVVIEQGETTPPFSMATQQAFDQGRDAFARFIQENVDLGDSAMKTVINSATPAFLPLVQTRTLAQRINDDASLDEGQKLAQAYGMVQAVNDASGMRVEDKMALKEEIVSGFSSLTVGEKYELLT